ncbi:MAG TPA: Gfo/Idh/MocA family oxidoreductase [Armatimonadetes bacterium]|nr:Gfo/Idh/MocA family oxidoreductase [Armatimonadota bacterium]
MAARTRIGFVGCGGIAEAHMKGLANYSRAALVAFCDPRVERAQEMAALYGTKKAQVFAEAKDMFATVELDAVYFCLPPFAHGAEFEAIERGIPFFVEKPVNLYLEQAREIAAAVEEKGLLTSVGYMNRYRKGVQRVKELLADDPPVLVLGGWIGGTPRPRPGVGIWQWWVQKDLSGGQFLEQVTHTVDLVRYLCGEAVEVQAYAARGFNQDTPENYSIEDASVVNIRLANGAVANLWASCSTNAGGGGVSLNIYASRTTAIFTGWEHSLHLLQAGRKPKEIPGEPDIFVVEDRAFIQAVRFQDPARIKSSYADGAKTLAVTVAANKSMETGRPVLVE